MGVGTAGACDVTKRGRHLGGGLYVEWLNMVSSRV